MPICIIGIKTNQVCWRKPGLLPVWAKWTSSRPTLPLQSRLAPPFASRWVGILGDQPWTEIKLPCLFLPGVLARTTQVKNGVTIFARHRKRAFPRSCASTVLRALVSHVFVMGLLNSSDAIKRLACPLSNCKSLCISYTQALCQMHLFSLVRFGLLNTSIFWRSGFPSMNFSFSLC